MSYFKAFIWVGLFSAVVYLVLTVLIDEQTSPNISSSLVPYVKEWKDDMDKAGIAYEADFNDIRHINLAEFFLDNKAGKSSRMSHTVYVDHELLKRGEFSVKATLYHELGHYIFQLEHGSCIIMEEKIRAETDYSENWDLFLKEYLITCQLAPSNS